MKDKVILSYKVLRTEGHTADDWNMMLMVEYKDRLEIRQMTGTRVARELVLEPRT